MYMSANFQVISDPVVFQNAQVTIYRAQKVVTMNPQMPWAECVAVAGGTIIAVGDFIDMEAYFKAHAASYQINDTFINNVIYPGFIEAHMHAQQSGLYNMNYVYIGYFDRHTADGEISRGCKTPDEIIAKLREVIEKNPGKSELAQYLWYRSADLGRRQAGKHQQQMARPGFQHCTHLPEPCFRPFDDRQYPRDRAVRHRCCPRRQYRPLSGRQLQRQRC